jgi:hypothetical protein
MALSFLDTPYSGMSKNLNPAYNDMVFVVNENKFKERNSFRYIFDVYVDGEKRGQMKHFPDFETGFGVVNVNQVVQSYLSHNLNCIKPSFNVVNKAVCTYQVKCGVEYSRRNRYNELSFVTINSIVYLRVHFEQPHNLRVGDILRLQPDNLNINPNANTTAMRVAQVVSDNIVRMTGSGNYTTPETVGGWGFEAENFNDNAWYPINGVAHVGFTIPNSRPTRIRVGDTVLIHQFGTPTNPQYNGEWKVIKIDNTYVSGHQTIVTNARWGVSTPAEEGMILSYNNYEFTEELSSASESTTWAFNGAFQYDETQKINITNFTPFINGRRFLSNAPKEFNITNNDFHTLSFLGGSQFNGNYTVLLNIETTHNNGTVTHHQYDGVPVNSFTTSSNNKEIIQEVGVGTGNIAALTTAHTWGNTTPISLTNIKSYKVWLSGADSNTSGVSTEKIKFNIVCKKKYQPIRLAWVNRYGTFDYFTFFLRNNKTLSVERNSFDKKLGKVQSDNKYNYNVGDRSSTVYNIKANDVIDCYSDFLTQNEAEWMEELFTSPEVYQIKDGKILPIILLNDNIEIGNKDNYNLIIYNIQFRYAFNKNTQRGGDSASNYLGATLPPSGTGTGSTGGGGTVLAVVDTTPFSIG